MADRLTKRRLSCAVAVAALLHAAAPARAQAGLADPTRPPGPAVADAALPAAGERGGARVLQSVLLPERGRPLAIINGQALRLGDRLGEHRLIELNERAAVLAGPEGSERLLLAPGVEKTEATTRPPRATVRRAAKGEKQ